MISTMYECTNTTRQRRLHQLPIFYKKWIMVVFFFWILNSNQLVLRLIRVCYESLPIKALDLEDFTFMQLTVTKMHVLNHPSKRKKVMQMQTKTLEDKNITGKDPLGGQNCWSACQSWTRPLLNEPKSVRFGCMGRMLDWLQSQCSYPQQLELSLWFYQRSWDQELLGQKSSQSVQSPEEALCEQDCP